MEAGYSGAMGSDEEPKKDEAEERVEKKKLNDDLAVFMRKCSESDVPRYYAMMKNYVKLQHKRKRADAARKRSEHGPGNQEGREGRSRKKADNDQKEKPSDSCVRQGGDEDTNKRRHGEKIPNRSGSISGQRSQEPADCGCRRRRSRRRCCTRRRRRSCRRRRRRRSRCRRRRRRSCRRRRRRRRR